MVNVVPRPGADSSSSRPEHCSMMLREIANSEDLIDLVGSGVEFMATTDLQETPLIHGRNLDVLLPKRIALMRAHLDDEPWIDGHYIERKAAEGSG